MKKLPTCKYCGKIGHYSYQCYQKNKILYQRRKEKLALEGFETACKPVVSAKKHKVSSRKRMTQAEQSERRRLIKELDRLTSLYVRYSHADKSGYVNCYTCGKRLPYRYVDNGHWQSRRYQQTRWDLDNCRPQCQSCNRNLNGNYKVYTPKLIKELGEEKAGEIKFRAHNGGKITTVEMEEMLRELKEKWNTLVKERKEKGWV